MLNYADAPGAPRQWWFGGGTDLTPAYIFEEDVKHFHLVCALANLLDIFSYNQHTGFLRIYNTSNRFDLTLPIQNWC